SQQIPFYSYCQNFIKSGGGTFSFETDLGSGFLSSYSFYLLGSPTFWLTTLFPAKAVPYLLVPLLCLKFAVAGVGVFAFAKRYIKDRNLTLLAAVLYTFSGFSVYNIFFNHFIEPIMLFPFLLWAMDEFFYDKKRGPFGIMVALSLLNNFFFFIGNVVFCIIYFIIKLACKDYVIKFKDFLLFVFEGVLGVLAAMCLVLPTALTLLNNPRVANWADGFGLVMYSQPQQYFAILSSLFLPPDPPYMPNIFTECNVKWTSLSAYLPLFSFAGVLCYLKQNKKTFFSRILCVCFVMALVPVLNSAFYGFNSSYYARWFYMPILIMSVCTVLSVRDANKNDVFKAIKITAVITGVFFIFGVLPKKTTDEATQVEKLVIGVTQEPAKLVLTVLTALLGLLAGYMILRFAKSKPRAVRALIACTMGFSVCFAIIHISLGKFPQWENDADYKQSVYDEKKALQEAL
ncbi:MAG: YfhO family protein, partial [Oscillospiraceae bacterium]